MSEYATDLIAERLVLASVLAAPTQSANIFSILPTDVWTDYRCSLVATVLAERYQRNIPIERLGLLRECADRAGTDHKAKQIGEFVYELGGTDLPPGGLGYYAERIVSLATIRRAHTAAVLCQQKLLGAADLDDDDIFRGAVTDMRQACDDALVSFKAQPLDPPLSAADLLTGSDEYDWLVPGLLEYTDRLIITGSEGLGKALAIDTPVPTPKGWTTMGSLTVGSEVFGLDGKPTRVVAATDVMHARPCYRVTFSDGAQIVADEQHMWLTWDRRTRKAYDYHCQSKGATYPDNWSTWSSLEGTSRMYDNGQRTRMREMRAIGMTCSEIGSVLGRTATAIQQQWNRPETLHPYRVTVVPVTTAHIAATLKVGTENNHSIPTTAPLQYRETELPIDPYVLGYLLGDGDTNGSGRVACDPRDRGWLVNEFTRIGYQTTNHVDPGHFGVRDIQSAWRSLGLGSGKLIPGLYMTASIDQRLALVQGLVDSDGYVDAHGAYRFSNTNPLLVDGFRDLVTSLGCVAQTNSRLGRLRAGNVSATCWDVIVPTEMQLSRLPRKIAKARLGWGREQSSRYITAVEPIESVPVRCIQVEQSDGMFIVGRECIPTHNSILSGQIAATVAAGIHPFSTEPLPKRSSGYRVLIVDCENSRRQLRRRFRSLLKQVDEACKNNGIEPADWNTALRFVIRPEGISLTEPRELTRMEQAVTATAPDLLVIGPMYRLSKVDVRDEQAAKELTDTIDLLRVRHNLTVVIETHAGHSTNSTGTRQLRPLGSSLFMRWPEFGYGLRTAPEAAHEEHPSVVEVGAWRGARDERNWPQRLRHGKTLPWEPADPEYWDRPTLREVS